MPRTDNILATVTIDNVTFDVIQVGPTFYLIYPELYPDEKKANGTYARCRGRRALIDKYPQVQFKSNG